MKHSDFSIGVEFMTESGQWRCTDVGTRTIIAIKVSEFDVVKQADDGQITSQIVSDDPSWFNGPPYAVAEHVFDEHSFVACRLNQSKR
jgi:hypothetical protein